MVSKPHGGTLVRKVASKREKERILSECREMNKINIDLSKAIDVENIAHGVYSPLEGFMSEEDYNRVLNEMRLTNDVPWTIPIVLDVSKKELNELRGGDEVILLYSNNPIALMRIEEAFIFNKREFAEKVFKTRDLNHPGATKTYVMKDLLISGEILLLNEAPNQFEKYTLRPVETRVLFREKGWKTIVGFQTRNAPHLGHEYLQKSALVFIDGLFINPVIGRKKRGDFRDEVILKAYEALIKNYYPRDSVVMSVLRYDMKYAGPREAIHHAIMRKNFGCTHFIVGRDHAGVGSYYKPYEAQEIFNEFPDLGITPLFFKEFFYCKKCMGIVNERVCPHEERVAFSGTMVRSLISRKLTPPPEFMRREVAEAILEFKNPFVE